MDGSGLGEGGEVFLNVDEGGHFIMVLGDGGVV